ncbi:outer membrane protein OmpA-like peptidoglycan-associated protein [Lewinella aquimaris]|uniref:Outer membrane protein OmpA-like peptidoglycan-associated protein n=1 Tax=Neolewinella aquimaris TaxID=1835722 RepID=A0A840EDD8_9BACT|nr:OmpA family protein [Neolewinella aquimaris]MBB4079819.1 outer membrane protein OmpA-like peptidoglycan-associated protein [Neolewinella aquimaris]
MRYFYLSWLLLIGYAVAAQTDGTITLVNPSFEDMPRVGAAPKGWTDCGFPGESAVDIQPDPLREFKVVKPAYHQYTYLGMVTRDNDTHERVGQRMNVAMVAGQCYELRIQLARSELYMSKSRLTDNDENYITPIKLRIRGGFDVCDIGEVMGESPLVSNWNWKEYRIKLKPQRDYTYIVLEAFYRQPILFPYNGNILLDDAKPITVVDCDEDLDAPGRDNPGEDALAEEEPDTDDTPGVRPRPATPSQSNRRPQEPKAPVVELGKTRGELKIGQVFEIENITFRANSAELERESEAALTEIADFLRHNTDVVVEIGGHASYRAGPVYASRISQERAIAVIDYLNSLDIGTSQMLPRGYGRSRPVCIEDTEECNQRNQRVEVKILKVRSSR